jgi:N-acetylglucosamine kinase-like BadF-type ATPase
VNIYLGVDGGGSKTAFLLTNAAGQVLAQHIEGSAYHPQVGIDAVRAVFMRGCEAIAATAGIQARDISFAFFGIPAHGEDSGLQKTLDDLPSGALPADRYRCGNDMVCAWAGSLAGQDGVNVVAGTGSICYGEYQGKQARAGGWGELFSDEGSAYWVAREGLSLFSRMSDGREERGILYDQIRAHFSLGDDLDICGSIYGADSMQRSELSQLAKLVANSAIDGDRQARNIFKRGAAELAAMIDAVRRRLAVPENQVFSVSYAGSVFQTEALCLLPLRQLLAQSRFPYQLILPRLPPAAGAALYAARLNGQALRQEAISSLEAQLRFPTS